MLGGAELAVAVLLRCTIGSRYSGGLIYARLKWRWNTPRAYSRGTTRLGLRQDEAQKVDAVKTVAQEECELCLVARSGWSEAGDSTRASTSGKLKARPARAHELMVMPHYGRRSWQLGADRRSCRGISPVHASPCVLECSVMGHDSRHTAHMRLICKNTPYVPYVKCMTPDPQMTVKSKPHNTLTCFRPYFRTMCEIIRLIREMLLPSAIDPELRLLHCLSMMTIGAGHFVAE